MNVRCTFLKYPLVFFVLAVSLKLTRWSSYLLFLSFLHFSVSSSLCPSPFLCPSPLPPPPPTSSYSLLFPSSFCFFTTSTFLFFIFFFFLLVFLSFSKTLQICHYSPVILEDIILSCYKERLRDNAWFTQTQFSLLYVECHQLITYRAPIPFNERDSQYVNLLEC